MDSGAITKGEIVSVCIRLCFGALASYFAMRSIMSAMDPNDKKNKIAKKKAQHIFKQLKISTKSQLTEHELIIASQIILPTDLNTSWKDVAGLSETIQSLNETLLWPVLQFQAGNSSSLLQPPKGILLHGPPGCGKTLLAKAIASETGATFINLDISSLTDKWYGESQKLSSAVFSLAAKVQPCIIFIDEIDSFLRVRNSSDHEATAMMKAQFLQQWDGLGTVSSNCIIVMGATNRPNDVDNAILRRMPSSFNIPYPNEIQRRQILRLILEEEQIGQDVDLSHFAAKTEMFSGSDLRELCRGASVNRLQNIYKRSAPHMVGGGNISREHNSSYTAITDNDMIHKELGPISKQNFDHSLNKMKNRPRLSNYGLDLD